MLSATLKEGLSDYAIGAQDSRAAAEEEDGARRARAAHRAVAGAALEDRARPAVSDAADAAAHRARLRRGPRVLLRRRAREAARRGRAEGASACGCPSGPARATVAYRFESLDYPATERRFNSYYAEFLPVAPEKSAPHDARRASSSSTCCRAR